MMCPKLLGTGCVTYAGFKRMLYAQFILCEKKSLVRVFMRLFLLE